MHPCIHPSIQLTTRCSHPSANFELRALPLFEGIGRESDRLCVGEGGRVSDRPGRAVVGNEDVIIVMAMAKTLHPISRHSHLRCGLALCTNANTYVQVACNKNYGRPGRLTPGRGPDRNLLAPQSGFLPPTRPQRCRLGSPAPGSLPSKPAGGAFGPAALSGAKLRGGSTLGSGTLPILPVPPCAHPGGGCFGGPPMSCGGGLLGTATPLVAPAAATGSTCCCNA